MRSSRRRSPVLPNKTEDVMQTHRFWVVGGEFRSMLFDQVVAGTEQLLGPFLDQIEAEQEWRRISEQHRHRCAVRFSIVREGQAA
jgi:hypothetical protein